MEQLSYEQIKNILESELLEGSSLDPEQWMHQELSDLEDIEDCETRDEFAKLGEFEVVDEYGGEGQGDDYYTVYYFKDHNVCIKFSGWYASSHGSEYEDMSEVFPQEVTKVQYLPKQKS